MCRQAGLKLMELSSRMLDLKAYTSTPGSLAVLVDDKILIVKSLIPSTNQL